MTTQKEEAPRGLTVEQIRPQLDQFEGQLVQFKQAELLLEFDKKNYEATLNRKIRMNNAQMKLTESNIAVLKKQIKKAMRSGN